MLDYCSFFELSSVMCVEKYEKGIYDCVHCTCTAYNKVQDFNIFWLDNATGNSDAAIECARILLSSPNIIPYDPCGPNRSCRTVMHIAANYTASKMLNFLWNKGFDHSKKDNRGLTPLMLAASASKFLNEDEFMRKYGSRGNIWVYIFCWRVNENELWILLNKSDGLNKVTFILCNNRRHWWSSEMCGYFAESLHCWRNQC